MLEMSSFHINSRAETFALLVNCVIDDALPRTWHEFCCKFRGEYNSKKKLKTG